jgi:hypothetical protein
MDAIQRNPSSGRAGSSGSRDGAAVDPTLDRSVAFWLRAYPRRWRVQRGGEVTAVLADIAGPGARRLDAAAAFGLVRGGWATRWREHPPLGVYLGFRLNNRPIPEDFREWARDDIEGPWFPARRGIWASWLIVLLGNLNALLASWSWQMYALGLGIAVAGACAFPDRMRSAAVRRHLALRAGERIVPGALIEGLAPRRRLGARGALGVVGGVLAVVGGAGLPTVSARPPMLLATAAAAVVGLVLVPLVRHRLRLLIAACPPQPHRKLVTRNARAWAGSIAAAVAVVVCLAAVVAVLAEDHAPVGALWLVTTGHLVRELSGLLAPVALLALPGVAAAARVVRRAGSEADGLSVSDVRSIVLRGRAPRVDEARLGLVHVDLAAADGPMAADEGLTITYLARQRPPRRRVEARGALTAALVLVGAWAVTWTATALIGPTTLRLASCAPSTEPGAARCPEWVATPIGGARAAVVLALVLAAAVGLAFVPLVRSRLRRLATRAPRQPHRELVPLSAPVRLAVAAGVTLIAAEAVLEATGRLGMVAAVALGPLALLALPGLTAAWLFARHSPDARGLAGSDVLRMVLRGRPPDVDRARRILAPTMGVVPVGTILSEQPLELVSPIAEFQAPVQRTFQPRVLPS